MSARGPSREVAYRIFASEFNDSTYTYAESDEERAPNYLVTPGGARVNRLFVVGVLTEVEQVSDDVVRARVVDPTGAFVIYAGQYQPEALAFFERADPPMFVAVTGKARTFQPDGSDRVFTSIRPETANEVDADTRDRWIVQTAAHTAERVAVFAKALERGVRANDLRALLDAAGVQPGVAAGIPNAIEAYDTKEPYLAALQSVAVDAARVVAGELEEVERTDVAPDAEGTADVNTRFADDVSLDQIDVDEESTPEPAETTVEDEPPAEGGEDRGPSEQESKSSAESVESTTDGDPESDEGADTEEESDAPDFEDEPERAGGDDESSELDEIASTVDSAGEAPSVESLDDVETDEMYELSEAEREEVHEQYDVGFESGADLAESDESEGMDDEGSSDAASEPAEAESEPTRVETDPPTEDADLEPSSEETDTEPSPEETDTEPPLEDTESETEPAGDDVESVSADELEDVVVETMKAEGDSDGIDRDVLIEAVVSSYDVEEADVEEAIEDALLGGRCFESGEDRLKPI